MCGRFAQTTPGTELVQLFSLIAGIEVAPRFNLAPTMNVTIVRETPNGRIGQQTRWGLVPGWAPDLKSGGNLFNARSETVFEKRSFAAAARSRRCIIPASGFYEWRDTPAGKLPTLFTPSDGPVFQFAGLWSTWADDNGEIVFSCTILTTKANRTMEPFHHRMPVMLAGNDVDRWLNSDITDPENLRPLFASAPNDAVRLKALTKRVNNVRNDDPQCWDTYTDSG
jgi:putative SOS response-associated peptidase YedK